MSENSVTSKQTDLLSAQDSCIEAENMNLDCNAFKVIANEIAQCLEVEENENKDQIVNDLLENGRQSLVKHENDIIREVYVNLMNEPNSKLIILLKKYFQLKWNTEYGTSSQWFVLFLQKYQNGEDNDLYERVLTRMAEYGNLYMKDCPILSLVLQLLFQSIDDECLKTTKIFDELWSSVTSDGLKSILTYSDYILSDTMNEQLNKTESILFLALCEYYRKEVFSLFEQYKIPNKRNLYEFALENIAEHGWKAGWQAAKLKMTGNDFKKLDKGIDAFLEKRKLSQTNGALVIEERQGNLSSNKMSSIFSRRICHVSK